MKTLVMFKLPGAGGKYATCSLSGLGTFPVKGHSYLLMDQVYEVTQVIEPISDEGGNAQILKLINLDQTDQESIVGAVGSMINLEGTDNPVSGLDEPDKVILVRLKNRKQKVEIGSLVLDVQALFSSTAEADDGENA